MRAGHDDDRADLRRRAGRRGTPDRSPHRRAGSARASARPRASARRDGRRRRDAVRLAQAVRAGQQFRRRQPAAGPPRAPPAPRCSGRPLPRCPRASDHAAAPAGGTLLRRRAPRTPGQPPRRDSRGLRRRVGAVSRRRGGGDPRPDRRQNVSRSRAYLRRAARGRDDRGPRGAPGVRRTGDGADRREGHRRGAQRGDRGPSRMGGSRRPCRKGGRAREHGRVGPVEPRVGRLQPLPPLHAANAAHAGHRGVAR